MIEIGPVGLFRVWRSLRNGYILGCGNRGSFAIGQSWHRSPAAADRSFSFISMLLHFDAMDRICIERPLIRTGLLIGLLLGVWSSIATQAQTLSVESGPASGERQPPSQSEIRKLIEKLGSDSYATRLRARERLQRIGLEAFDELHLAQFHSDSEVAMTASDLVSSLQVSWSKETDPPEVRAALNEYGAQSESERLSRIEMLAEMSDRKGLPALVRLVRFEKRLRLSQRAALALMQQPMSDDPDVRQRRAEQITAILGTNDRQSAQWLRVYALDLSGGEYSADPWRDLLVRQRQQIDTGASEDSTRPSVLELVRVCAVRASAAGQHDEALRLARQNIDLIPPTSRDLVDACSWAIDNQLHPFVLELSRQHQRIFSAQPMLLYGAAEATKVAGDQVAANQLAERASQIQPLPKDQQERDKLSPKEIDETAQAHRTIGQKLQERGLFHWAEREFRQIIDAMDVDSQPASVARVHLARMLAELTRYEEAAEVLKPLTERIEKDDKFKQGLRSVMYAYNGIKSDQNYYEALAMIERGETEAAKPLLQHAFRMQPDNIDILITMYRLKSDQQWNQLVLDTLEKTVHRLGLEVQSAELQARQAGRMRLSQEFLGNELNQYAWLVSNTQGDYQKALNFSLRSLEIDSDAPKMDTCARCYFAMGDYENAARMQRRAVRLMPHSPPMLRQLSEFEAKLDPSTAEE